MLQSLKLHWRMEYMFLIYAIIPTLFVFFNVFAGPGHPDRAVLLGSPRKDRPGHLLELWSLRREMQSGRYPHGRLHRGGSARL